MSSGTNTWTPPTSSSTRPWQSIAGWPAKNPTTVSCNTCWPARLTHSGDLAARAGRGDEARKAYREAVDLRIALVQRHPDVLEYRAALVTTADNFGVFCSDRGEVADAQTYYQHALAQAERLAADYPKQPEYQSSYATVLVNAAMLSGSRNLRGPGRAVFDARLPNPDQTLAGRTKRPRSVRRNWPPWVWHWPSSKPMPTTARRRKNISTPPSTFCVLSGRLIRIAPCSASGSARASSNWGISSNPIRRNDEAVTAYREAQQLQRRLVADHPTVLNHRRNLAATCINLGNLQNRNGQVDPGRSNF